MIGLDRFALNQATVRHASFDQLIAACNRHNVPAVALWRDTFGVLEPHDAGRRLADVGLAVSCLCRAGFVTAIDAQARQAAFDDNVRALDEAAAVGTDTLVVLSGGLVEGDRNLPATRGRVLDAIAELVPEAVARGVRLALEPLHPMFCADRSVLTTLGEALDIAEQFPVDAVGVVVDTYHLWWDPQLAEQIERAGDRIAIFQVSDWVVPLPVDMLLGRGHVGEGHIDVRAIAAMVEKAGYTGYVETEIFNEDIWRAPVDDTVALAVRRFREHLG